MKQLLAARKGQKVGGSSGYLSDTGKEARSRSGVSTLEDWFSADTQTAAFRCDAHRTSSDFSGACHRADAQEIVQHWCDMLDVVPAGLQAEGVKPGREGHGGLAARRQREGAV